MEEIKIEQQGTATIAEWLDAPEGERKELIRGVFYDMATPTVRHQVIVDEVRGQFRDHIREKGGDCLPLTAPIGVQLNEDEDTVLEPDLIVVCDPTRFSEADGKYLVGAPDFVLEVLSPSTRKRDMTIKLRLYEEAGVREYWVIDPEKEVVITYVFAEETSPTIYRFDDVVPVAIYGGELDIRFPEIREWLMRFTGQSGQ